jgi:hypothetical protein
MTDEELTTQFHMLQAHLFAQGWVMQALIDTHPRRDLLLEEFQHLAERHIAQALGGASSSESIAAFEGARDRWLQWMRRPGGQG